MSSYHALSDGDLSDLTCKLRYANARYTRVAFDLRRRIPVTRTHHAKCRAFWAGLRVDIERANSCPMAAIAARPMPVLDTTSSPSPTMLSFHGSAIEPHNQLGLEVPHVLLTSHDTCAYPSERITIRIPPLASLHDDVFRYEQHGRSAPGAPLIRTKELPGNFDMEGISSSRSPSPAPSLSPLTPIDIVHSGIRIKIPIRKRKIGETDDEDSCPDSSDMQFPKKYMRRRWARSQTTEHQVYWSPLRSQPSY